MNLIRFFLALPFFLAGMAFFVPFQIIAGREVVDALTRAREKVVNGSKRDKGT